MKKLQLVPGIQKLIFTVSVVFSSVIVSAHHSHSNLDRNDIQQHRGVVTEYNWRSPHVFIKANAPNREGEIVEYSIELLHPPAMQRRGWSSDSFKPGDTITWEGASDKNPDRYYSGLSWAQRGDGQYFGNEIDEGEVAPSTDFTGSWVRDLRGGPGTYYPPEGWPLTELAQNEVDNFDVSQNPALQCEEQGPPKATTLPYPIKISRPDENTIVMDYELRSGSRIIYLGDAPEPGEPTIWGHSVGRFEGDELVVETNNFLAQRWGNATGINSSDEKHLVERFKLTNGGMSIEMEMTVSDPMYLSEPHTFEYYLSKIQDRDFVQVECSEESARLYMEGGYSE